MFTSKGSGMNFSVTADYLQKTTVIIMCPKTKDNTETVNECDQYTVRNSALVNQYQT